MADELTFRAFVRLRKPLLKSQLPFLKDCQIQARLKKQWSMRKKEFTTTQQLSELNKADYQGVDGMTDAVKIKTKHSILEADKSSSDCSTAESHKTSLYLPPISSSSSSVKKLRARKAGNQGRKKVKNSKVAGGKATETKLGANSKSDSGVGKMVSGYLHHSYDSSESSPPPLSIDINACQTVKPYPLPAISQSSTSQCKADMSPSPQDTNDSVNTHKPSSQASLYHIADNKHTSLSNKPMVIKRKSKTRIRRPPLLKGDKLAVTQQQALCANAHQEGLAQFTNVQHEEETVETNEGEGKEGCGGKNMTCNQLQEGGDDTFFISKGRKEQQHTAKVGGAMCALFLPFHSTSDSTNQIESVPDTDNDDSLPLGDEDSIFL